MEQVSIVHRTGLFKPPPSFSKLCIQRGTWASNRFSKGSNPEK